jgi:TolB-like protein
VKATNLILIDGSGYIFRAFHALPPMTRPDGTPVNAVFGFTNMLAQLLKDHTGSHIAVIFDAGRLTFRNRLYEQYKAHRPPPPEELIPQFEAVLTPSGGITPHATAPYARAMGVVRGSRRTRTTIAAAAAVLVAIALGVAYARRESPSSPLRLAASAASATKPVWLAVLPPQYAGRPEDDWFSDGLADELRGALVKIPGVQVKGSRSSQTFKGTAKTIPEIARTVNVRYVMEGSVRKAGNDLRITAQLIDASTDAHLWAEKYGGTLDDNFDIQEKVTHSIVDALNLKLTPQEVGLLAERPIPSALAYEFYLKAKREILSSTKEGFDRALRYPGPDVYGLPNQPPYYGGHDRDHHQQYGRHDGVPSVRAVF